MGTAFTFDGAVHDQGSKGPNKVFFSVTLVGMETEKMKAHLLKECRERGLKALDVKVGPTKDGRFAVTIEVESDRGIL